MSCADELRVDGRAGPPVPRAPERGRVLSRLLADRRVLPLAIVALALVPMVVGIVRVLVDHRSALHGDDALIELRVRDVGGSHTPLVGAYGRYGFNQPGPILFYLYAIPYRALGSTFAGIQVGCLLLGMASIVAIAVVAWRRGGTGLLVWALLLTLVLVRYVPSHLTDPWEPYAVVLPLAALVFLTFDAVVGDRWALPFVLAVASLLAGTQPVTSPVAVVLAVTAVVGVVLRTRGGRDGGWLRPVAVSAVVVGVLWAPPIVDAIVHDPSNVQRLWRFLQAPHHVLGLGDAYRVLALQFGVPAPWNGGRTVLSVFEPTLDLAATPAVPIALLVVVAGVLAAARHRKRAAWLGVVALLAFGAGVLAMSRLVGPLYVWIPQWTRAVGMVCWVAGGWCLFAAFPDGVRARLGRPLLAACAAAVVVIVSANAVVSATEHPPRDPLEAAVVRLAAAGVATARVAGGPVLVRSDAGAVTPLGGDEVSLELLALALERRGIRVVVESRLVDRFGVGRARPQPVREELVIVPASHPVPTGYRLVATADPLTPRQRADRDRITAELGSFLARASLRQISDRAQRDPRFRARYRRLQQIPDLPSLALITRPRAHS